MMTKRIPKTTFLFVHRVFICLRTFFFRMCLCCIVFIYRIYFVITIKAIKIIIHVCHHHQKLRVLHEPTRKGKCIGGQINAIRTESEQQPSIIHRNECHHRSSYHYVRRTTEKVVKWQVPASHLVVCMWLFMYCCWASIWAGNTRLGTKWEIEIDTKSMPLSVCVCECRQIQKLFFAIFFCLIFIRHRSL